MPIFSLLIIRANLASMKLAPTFYRYKVRFLFHLVRLGRGYDETSIIGRPSFCALPLSAATASSILKRHRTTVLWCISAHSDWSVVVGIHCHAISPPLNPFICASHSGATYFQQPFSRSFGLLVSLVTFPRFHPPRGGPSMDNFFSLKRHKKEMSI